MHLTKRRTMLRCGLPVVFVLIAASAYVGYERRTFELENPRTGQITALAFSPSGEWLAGSDLDGGVCVWSVKDRSLVRRVPRAELSHDEYAWSIAFTSAGLLVTGADALTLDLLTVPGLARGPSLADGGELLRGRAVAAVGSRVARTAGKRSEREIHVWDVGRDSAKLVRRFGSATFVSVAFDRTGRRVVALDAAGDVTVHATDTGAATAVVRGHELGVIAVSATDELIAVGANMLARVEVLTFEGKTRRVLELSEPPMPPKRAQLFGPESFWKTTALAFSRDGAVLAVTAQHWDSGTSTTAQVRHSWLELWDVVLGERLRTIDLGYDYADAVAFSPTDDLLAVSVGPRVRVLRR